MAERPFAPGFALSPKATNAGAYSPVSIESPARDGQQELKGVDVTLAPGMTGKLAGIPYCPEAALAAAAANSGAAERAASSCPAQSLVGSAAVAAGTGPAPLRIAGKVFLSGPYRGAPLSLAVVTPATAGPFDLGTVVVRVALFVDPETAQIRALSDPVPNVYGGAQLSIRSVDVDLDRKNFTLNPTSCGPLVSAGVLNGGGADPANPAAFSAFPVSIAFQTTECGGARLPAEAVDPAVRREEEDQAGPAPEIPRRPHRPQWRRQHRPRRAHPLARALPRPVPHPHDLHPCPARCGQLPEGRDLRLRAAPRRRCSTIRSSGPVYLTSSNNPLPDLLVDLRGQVDVRLRGVISTAKNAGSRPSSLGARRAGQQVHDHDERRQTRPPGQLARPLRAPLLLVHELQSPERQEAAGETPADAGARLQAGWQTAPALIEVGAERVSPKP